MSEKLQTLSDFNIDENDIISLYDDGHRLSAMYKIIKEADEAGLTSSEIAGS